MSTAEDQSACRRFDRWLMPYVDGELDAIHCLEVEDHLDACVECRDIVDGIRATKHSVRRVCAVRAPTSLRERLAAQLDEERARLDAAGRGEEGRGEARIDSLEAHVTSDDEDGVPPSLHEPEGSVRPAAAEPTRSRLRWMVPMAAAATFALVVGAMQLQDAAPARDGAVEGPVAEFQGNPDDYPTAGLPVATTTASLDGLVEDLVAQHLHPPPPETTDPDGLSRFDPYIGVRVRQPRFQHVQAQYVGARMQQRAALLQYVVDRSPVTMYVFDPKRVPMRATRRLQPQKVGSNRVFVGELKGCAVAASEHNGVGYALASSTMGRDEVMQMLVQAQR
ncbi:MAG: zf-HC2 domain-containing protein [Myxococcota bacterium]